MPDEIRQLIIERLAILEEQSRQRSREHSEVRTELRALREVVMKNVGMIDELRNVKKLIMRLGVILIGSNAPELIKLLGI